MNKIIIFAVAFFSMNSAWAQQASTAAPISSTETVNGDNVPIEEYVPKVIIEGKWGTGPGEFGRQSDVDYDFKPESLAVDSKGNIYILDFVNNRIQKFSSEGKYLRSIKIDGLKGPINCWAYETYDPVTGQTVRSVGLPSNTPAISPEKPQGIAEDKLIPYIWPPEVQGVSIVIDSKDTLYYYLKRVNNGKEIGEVWEFKNDKFMKKTPGNILESIGKRNIRKEIAVKNRDKKEIAFGDLQGKTLTLKTRKGEEFFDDVSAKKRRISNKVRMGKDGLLGVACEANGGIWTNYYTASGKLVKRFKWGSLPEITTDMSDDNGNMYLPEATGNGFKVTKYELGILK